MFWKLYILEQQCINTNTTYYNFMRAEKILLEVEKIVLEQNIKKDTVYRYFTYHGHTLSITGQNELEISVWIKEKQLAAYTIDCDNLYEVVKSLLVQIDAHYQTEVLA